MTCTISLWLSALYVVCCHLQVTSGSEVFLVKAVSSQRVCEHFCVYTSRCQSYRWDATTRACHLSAQLSSTATGFANHKPHNGQCGHRLCAQTETCVPVNSATEYICLETTLPTSFPATPSTSTTTSVPAVTTIPYTSPIAATTSVVPSTTASTTTSATLTTTTAFPVTTTTSFSSTTTSVPAVTTTTYTSPSATTTYGVQSTTTTATTPGSTTTLITTTVHPNTSTNITTTTDASSTTTTTLISTASSPTTSITFTTTPTTTYTQTTSTTMTTTTAPTSTSATTTTTTPTTTTTTTTVTTTTASGPVYRGCYVDDLNRVLPYEHLIDTALMTIELCRVHCTGYSFFGLEVGVECLCGNEIKSGYTQVSDNQCDRPCAADPTNTCGGNWRIAIYEV